MITQQQIGARKSEIVGGQFGSARNEGAEVVNLRKRCVDPRNQMYGYQVEVERRDIVTVAVLGYN
ncbi:hypothetical protein GPA22_08325 [Aromatoleum toluvorans]|uniref:Uncharacterized protein n=1 Tax=Aromatoleum toluvorans TaxID=92002 RepID=A0ABX1PYN5_9RHOO|nr:hypothetical protein [Aromatoleum toluvorans]NMG43737.1 hypothetical protein [Aromatoleum toluvorans]